MRIRSLTTFGSIGLSAWMVSILLGALIGSVGAYWGLALFAPRAPIAPPPIALDTKALPELQQAALLFGSNLALAPPAQSQNIKVLGIVAAGERGSAILSISDAPARAYAVGEALRPGQRLHEVRSDAIVIRNGSSEFEVASPQTSSLAVLSSGPNQPPSTYKPAPPPRALAPRSTPPARTTTPNAVRPVRPARTLGQPTR